MTRQTILTRQDVANKQVRNKLVTSRCDGIWETTTQQAQRTFAHANLLQTCYGESMGKLV